jgi:hypothetical protein
MAVQTHKQDKNAILRLVVLVTTKNYILEDG